MQTPSLLLLLGAIITGAVVPFQAGANAAMGRALGHPLWGSVVSLCVSLICIAPILAVARVKAPALGQLAHTPPWVWIGGMVGLGTVISGFMIGFCIQTTFRLLKFDPTKITHSTMRQSFRELQGVIAPK